MWDKTENRGSPLTNEGGSKKFLYSGPINSKGQTLDDDPFFSPKVSKTPRGTPVDLDDVWSIRNVGLGQNSNTTSDRSGSSPFKPPGINTSSIYYSRHTGVKGGKTEVSPRDIQSSIPPTGSKWSSSGHNFGQSRQRQGQSSRQSDQRLPGNNKSHQAQSSFSRDINDF